jgi:hypothetical protein
VYWPGFCSVVNGSMVAKMAPSTCFLDLVGLRPHMLWTGIHFGPFGLTFQPLSHTFASTVHHTPFPSNMGVWTLFYLSCVAEVVKRGGVCALTRHPTLRLSRQPSPSLNPHALTTFKDNATFSSSSRTLAKQCVDGMNRIIEALQPRTGRRFVQIYIQAPQDRSPVLNNVRYVSNPRNHHVKSSVMAGLLYSTRETPWGLFR